MNVMRHKSWVYALALVVWFAAEAGGAASHLAVNADDSNPPGSAGTAAVEKSFPAQGIDQVQVNVQVGSICVRTDRACVVQVKAVRRVEGLSSGEASRWLERARVVIERQGKTIVVRDIVPDDQS